MDLAKLKQVQKDLEKKRKAINAQIKKAEIEDKTNRYINAGKELAEHFRIDPQCVESSKIAAICSKYFAPTVIETGYVEIILPRDKKEKTLIQ